MIFGLVESLFEHVNERVANEERYKPTILELIDTGDCYFQYHRGVNYIICQNIAIAFT